MTRISDVIWTNNQFTHGQINYATTPQYVLNHLFRVLFENRISNVGGQCCPDSVRNYCPVSVGQNQVQIRNPDTQKPSRLKISNFDWLTPHAKSGQNPDSAVRRRLRNIIYFFMHDLSAFVSLVTFPRLFSRSSCNFSSISESMSVSSVQV